MHVEHLVRRDLAPKLRGVRDEDLGEGADRAGLFLLPDQHEDALVEVPADERGREEVDIGVPHELLPADQPLRLRALQQRLDDGGIVRLAVARRIRHGAAERVLRDGVVQRDILEPRRGLPQQRLRELVRVGERPEQPEVELLSVLTQPRPLAVYQAQRGVPAQRVVRLLQQLFEEPRQRRLEQGGEHLAVFIVDLAARSRGGDPVELRSLHRRAEVGEQRLRVERREPKRLFGRVLRHAQLARRLGAGHGAPGVQQQPPRLGIGLSRLRRREGGDGLLQRALFLRLLRGTEGGGALRAAGEERQREREEQQDRNTAFFHGSFLPISFRRGRERPFRRTYIIPQIARKVKLNFTDARRGDRYAGR